MLTAACASSGGVRAREGCALRGTDSTFAGRAPVYRDCAVDRKVKLITTSLIPDYRPAVPRSECVSAETEFVVDTLGRVETGTARLLHASNSALGDAVMSLLPRLRYEPALLNGVKVRQIATDKHTVNSTVVVVKAGSSPPASSGAGRHPTPNC